MVSAVHTVSHCMVIDVLNCHYLSYSLTLFKLYMSLFNNWHTACVRGELYMSLFNNWHTAFVRGVLINDHAQWTGLTPWKSVGIPSFSMSTECRLGTLCCKWMVLSNFCQMFLTAFWDVMPYILAASYQCFGGTCCFCLSSRWWR
jgi:hypothetical protein